MDCLLWTKFEMHLGVPVKVASQASCARPKWIPARLRPVSTTAPASLQIRPAQSPHTDANVLKVSLEQTVKQVGHFFHLIDSKYECQISENKVSIPCISLKIMRKREISLAFDRWKVNARLEIGRFCHD